MPYEKDLEIFWGSLSETAIHKVAHSHRRTIFAGRDARDESVSLPVRPLTHAALLSDVGSGCCGLGLNTPGVLFLITGLNSVSLHNRPEALNVKRTLSNNRNQDLQHGAEQCCKFTGLDESTLPPKRHTPQA